MTIISIYLFGTKQKKKPVVIIMVKWGVTFFDVFSLIATYSKWSL